MRFTSNAQVRLGLLTSAMLGVPALASADIHETAIIEEGAVVAPDADIGAHAYIAAGAVIRPGASVGVRARIESGVVIGEHSMLADNVHVQSSAMVGYAAQVGSGSVLEEGVIFDDGVTLGSGVRVGAYSMVSHGVVIGSNTALGDGAWLGEGVYIGPNVRMGAWALLQNGAFIETYNHVGDRFTLGPQAQMRYGATAGHSVTVGAESIIKGALADSVYVGPWARIGNQTKVGRGAILGSDVRTGIFVTIEPGAALGSRVTLAESVTVGPNSEIGDDCTLGSSAQIGAGTRLGELCEIGNSVRIAPGSQVGAECTFKSRSRIDDGALIGDRVMIRERTRLGAGVIIGNDVDVYPDSTIGDAATLASGIILGAANCRTHTCGQVRVGACSEIDESMPRRSATADECTDGSSPERPGRTCKILLDEGETEDGMYWLDPDGTGPVEPFSAWCDMHTHGGGWTRVTPRIARDVFLQGAIHNNTSCSVAQWAGDHLHFGEVGNCEDGTDVVYNFVLPFTYRQFYLDGFMVADGDNDGSWTMGSVSHINDISWGPTPSGQGYGDIAFGTIDQDTPTTSFGAAGFPGDALCPGCTAAFPGNAHIFELDAESQSFAIKAHAPAGSHTDLFVWTKGYILFR
ncbi:MAG: fibrinogen-like YCDxxxxGGGW domain-containing protein [Bradymonadia bacterium]